MSVRHTWQTSLLQVARYNVCRKCVLVRLFRVKTLISPNRIFFSILGTPMQTQTTMDQRLVSGPYIDPISSVVNLYKTALLLFHQPGDVMHATMESFLSRFLNLHEATISLNKLNSMTLGPITRGKITPVLYETRSK